MLFNSLEFALFFPIVTALYFMLPHRHRWWLLLSASCVFYMAFIPAYVLILAFTIFIDYVAGILIETAQGQVRKHRLWLSLIANIGVLAIFKYINFLTGIFNLGNTIFSALILPIGLSFHTFQSMSYTIEVYRGKQQAVRHLGLFALYVMFYPQLVAGPIERPQNLLRQFTEPHRFDAARVSFGLQLMAWGFFKKVVIADRLAVLVNQVYANPMNRSGFELLAATMFFTFQIYCDFSGYSDIARGAAQVIGFELMQNFRRPYLARSISDFWSRWHISLSTWFRDYLYIPLGGNRVVRWRWQFNVFIVFLMSGFWHGANWTYILWGALHGAFTILAIWFNPLLKRPSEKLTGFFTWLLTFVCVCVAWVFFRAKTVPEAWYIVTHLSFVGADVRKLAEMMGGNIELGLAIGGVIFLMLVELYQESSLRLGSMRQQIARLPAWGRYALYYGVIMAILVFGKFFSEQAEFIYFQF